MANFDLALSRISGVNNPKYKHGGKNTRLYSIWKDMRKRCNNHNSISYPYYGGKGVKVVAEWDDFEAFRSWSILNGYDDKLTIDRINSSGNYEPQNCRWVTSLVQHRNQSNNRYITYEGSIMTISEACEKFNIKSATLIYRLNKGWPIERTLNERAVLGKNKTSWPILK